LTGANLVNEVQARINTALAVLVPAPTVAVSFDEASGVGRVLRLTASSGHQANVRVRRAPANDLSAALMLGVTAGGVELSRWHSLRPAATGSVLPLGTTPMGLENLNTLAALTQGAVTNVTVGTDPA